VLFHSGSEVTFVIGLAMTTLASVIFEKNLVVAIGVAAVTIGFYFLMGLYAQRGRLWAFYVGLVIYAIDALIYAWAQDWMSVAFHVLAVFFISKGILRVRELSRASAPEASGA